MVGVIYFGGEETDANTEFTEFIGGIRRELDRIEKIGAAELLEEVETPVVESDGEDLSEDETKIEKTKELNPTSGGILDFIE